MTNHHVITATEASRTLSDLLNKVHYQHQSFDVKRGKEVIARIVPATSTKKLLKVSELNDLFKRAPSLEKNDAEEFQKSIEEMRSKMQIRGNLWD